MLRTDVAKIVAGILAAAAAAVAILSYLTPFVGAPYAIAVVVMLVVGATIVVSSALPAATPPDKEGRQPAPRVSRTHEEITIVSRSFDVDSEKPVSVDLPIHKGDYVFGRIEEEDRQDFSWYIMDGVNLRKFHRGDEFDYEDGEANVTATALDWTVPRNTAWYLVIDVSMKQYVRRVTITLKRRARAPD